MAAALLFGPGLMHRREQPSGAKPVVIGHRGSVYGVENTEQALRSAVEAGADLLEIDVLLSADGVPVVCHDNNLKRLAGIDMEIANTTIANLNDIQLSQNGYQSELMTLEQAIKYADGHNRVLVEPKPPYGPDMQLVVKVMEVAKATGKMGN